MASQVERQQSASSADAREQWSSFCSSFDVVVVGAGIMGSCTAYELAKRGHSTLLLEQFDFLHRRGSSHGESRIIRRTYPEDFYTDMMPRAYALWQAAAGDAGYSPLTTTGSLDFGPADSADLQHVLSACRRHGVPHEVLRGEKLCRRFPQFRFRDGSVGVVCPEGGVVNATKACAMFQQLAAKQGAVLRDRTKVIGVEVSGSEGAGEGRGGGDRQGQLSSEGKEDGEGQREGPPWGVGAMERQSGSGFAGVLEWKKTRTLRIVTDRGIVSAAKCVFCAGAWSSDLIKRVSGITLPIQPLNTHVLYWSIRAGPEVSLEASRGFPVFINYDEPYVYGTPVLEYPGLVKISLHSGEPCDPDLRSLLPPPASTADVASTWVRERMGEVVEGEVAMAEACMYSMTPDQDFVIDFVPLEKFARGAVTSSSAATPQQQSPSQSQLQPQSQSQSLSPSAAQPPPPPPPSSPASPTPPSPPSSSLPLPGPLNRRASPAQAEDKQAQQLLLVGGFSGHGFKFGPLIGKVAADMIETGSSEDAPLELFQWQRFLRGSGKGNEKANGPQVRPPPSLSAKT